jgi:hypothetical protein
MLGLAFSWANKYSGFYLTPTWINATIRNALHISSVDRSTKISQVISPINDINDASASILNAKPHTDQQIGTNDGLTTQVSTGASETPVIPNITVDAGHPEFSRSHCILLGVIMKT